MIFVLTITPWQNKEEEGRKGREETKKGVRKKRGKKTEKNNKTKINYNSSPSIYKKRIIYKLLNKSIACLFVQFKF